MARGASNDFCDPPGLSPDALLDALFDPDRDPDPDPLRPPVIDWTTTRETWTVTQIAEQLDYDPRSIRLLCESGVIPAKKTSTRGHYRVAAADLRTWLNGHAQPLAA